MPTSLLQKVAFTLFPVVDPVRARAFYEDTLGLTRGLASPDGTWTEYDLPGGGCLALFRHPDPAHRQAPGGGAIAFEVPVIHGPRCRMSNIVDSEVNAIILHELNR